MFAPCPTGWRHASDDTIEMSRLAVETGVFVLWELEGGYDPSKINVTYKPKERKPVIEYLKGQRRFAHLMDKPEELKKIQDEVDAKCKMFGF